jgi:hypothetical protein
VPRGILGLGCLVVLPALLVACGGDDDDATGAPPPDTSAEVAEATACSLVDAGAAQTVFGIPAQPQVQDQPDGVISQCIWEATDRANGQLLQFRIFDDERKYSEDLAEGAQPLEDLGELAYLDTEGPAATVDLQFVRDGYVFAFAYSHPSGDPATNAPQLETLARAVEAKL